MTNGHQNKTCNTFAKEWDFTWVTTHRQPTKEETNVKKNVYMSIKPFALRSFDFKFNFFFICYLNIHVDYANRCYGNINLNLWKKKSRTAEKMNWLSHLKYKHKYWCDSFDMCDVNTYIQIWFSRIKKCMDQLFNAKHISCIFFRFFRLIMKLNKAQKHVETELFLAIIPVQ